jgi:hypothetical protein
MGTAMKLSLHRTDEFTDSENVQGVHGLWTMPGFSCFTCENLLLSIPEGLFEVTLDVGTHINYLSPHIHCLERDHAARYGDAGIRVHIANWPHELKGCIAPGLKQTSEGVMYSEAAFSKIMDILRPVTETILLDVFNS